MPIANATNVQKAAPAAANNLSVTPGGASFANGSWVEFIASAPTDLVLCGLVVVSPTGTVFARNAEIEIGVGGAGSEVAKGALPWLLANDVFGPATTRNILPSVFLNVTSGSRIAIRIRHNQSSTAAYTVALLYYEKPIVGALNTTTQPWKIAPASAGSVVISTPASWSNSSWSEVVANTSAAWVVIGLLFNGTAPGVEGEVDVGTGSAGSEVVVTTMRDIHIGTAGTPPAWVPLWIPLDNIAASTRVAVRARSSSTGTINTQVSIAYVEKPL